MKGEINMQAGQYITDGTVRWLVVDIRDGSMVGDITYSPILRPGHVKANGALLASASVNYPRLVSFAVDNNLTVADDAAWESNKAAYVYDETNDTLRVPDATGRALQGGASVQSVEAGLPNVTGSFSGQVGHVFSTNKSTGFQAHGAYLTPALYGADSYVSVVGDSRADTFTFPNFSAQGSNPIYSASTTVQPPALTQIAQIRY